MDSGSWVTPVVLLGAIVALLLAGFGIYWLVNKRRRLGIGMLAAAVLVVGVPAAIAAWWPSWEWWADKEDMVTVQGLDPDTDPAFVVEIPHLIGVGPTPDYYDFFAAGSQAEVIAAFQAQHPDGKLTDPTTETAEGSHPSLWHVSTDRMRYELIPGANTDGFAVVGQVATLESEDGSTVVRIPFPSYAIGSPPWSELTTLHSDWTDEDWQNFYADIGDVVIAGNTITMPTDTDLTATITLNGDSVNFRIND